MAPRALGWFIAFGRFAGLYVLKCRNNQCGYDMCMSSQIVWYTTPNEEEENVCTVCLCLCAHAWVKLCTRTYCMGICCCIALTCCRVLTCDWRQQVVRVGAAAPQVFNSEILVLWGNQGMTSGLIGSQLDWPQATTCIPQDFKYTPTSHLPVLCY